MTYETTLHFRRALAGVRLCDRNGNHAPAGDVTLYPHRAPVPCPPDHHVPAETAVIEKVLAGLQDIAAELRTQQRQRLHEMQQVAVELAMAIASHLVHERIKVSDMAVEGLVHKVVQRLEPKHAVTVHLHPDDIALLEKRLAGKPLVPAKNVDLHIHADGTLQRGDCRAESGDVSIVWQLEDQLANLRRHLLRSLSDPGTDRSRVLVGERHLRRFPEQRQTA